MADCGQDSIFPFALRQFGKQNRRLASLGCKFCPLLLTINKVLLRLEQHPYMKLFYKFLENLILLSEFGETEQHINLTPFGVDDTPIDSAFQSIFIGKFLCLMRPLIAVRPLIFWEEEEKI